MVLEVYHVLPVQLSAGLELKYSFLTLIQWPLLCLVQFWHALSAILNIEGLEVQSIHNGLVVDIAGGWGRAVVLMPVQRGNVEHSHLASTRRNVPTYFKFRACTLCVWKMSEGCPKDVWRVSEGCLDGSFRVSGEYLEGV